MTKGNRTKGTRAGRPRKPKAELRVQTAFRLTPDGKRGIRMLAQHWGCSQADAIERATSETLKYIVLTAPHDSSANAQAQGMER